MPAAESLRDLHGLHQRAKGLRDRLESGPKTLAAREAVLATRRKALEEARQALKEGKAHQKARETQLQGLTAKMDDLRTKLNTIKKQAEYDAIRNQIAHDNAASGKLQDEILEEMGRNEERAAALAAAEADVAKLEGEVAALKADLEAKAVEQRAQLAELEAAIAAAEAIIPADQREQYLRVVKQRGADAFSAVDPDVKACSGCFLSVTAQCVNDLINVTRLNFCKSCGRILYLAEEEPSATRRKAR